MKYDVLMRRDRGESRALIMEETGVRRDTYYSILRQKVQSNNLTFFPTSSVATEENFQDQGEPTAWQALMQLEEVPETFEEYVGFDLDLIGRNSHMDQDADSSALPKEEEEDEEGNSPQEIPLQSSVPTNEQTAQSLKRPSKSHVALNKLREVQKVLRRDASLAEGVELAENLENFLLNVIVSTSL